MISHFIYEEFHPDDEDDITEAIDEFLYAFFKGELKARESMFYHGVSEQNMHDANGKRLSMEEFKELVSNFYETYPIVIEHSAEVKHIVIDGDTSTAQSNISWHAIPKGEEAIVGHEGLSEFKLTRSIYGGRDIIQANIPGWVWKTKEQ